MASATTVALAGGAATLALYWLKRKFDDAQEPPSVGRYPIVGSYFHLAEPLYLSMHEKFGHEQIVRVHFGTQCVYFFNRWASFKEAMIDNAEQLSGRSRNLAVRLFGEYGGIGGTEGEVWREYRRFTLKTLRDFGFGRQGAEEIIALEAEHMRCTLDAACEKAIESGLVMSTATSNVICQLVFGSRLASEEENFGEIISLFRSITQDSGSNANRSILMSILPLVERVPILFNLMTSLPKTKEFIAKFRQLHAYCKLHRDKHMVEMDKIDQARDYIEAHLLHQRTDPKMFTDTRLTLAVSDLFLAGTDTTANTLRWAILYMIGNPDVAERTHKEIVDAIGRDRLPKMQDKQSLHYTQAVIEEVHRKSCLVPLGVFHRVTEDITVSGVRLKANSICGFNVYSIHHDPELFPEPQRFLPERHLKDGQFVPCPHLATFGLGKRACLGESLAKMELFIFFTVLMQRYRFSLDPEDSRTLWHLTEDPEFSKGTGLRAPPVHKIVFSARV